MNCLLFFRERMQSMSRATGRIAEGSILGVLLLGILILCGCVSSVDDSQEVDGTDSDTAGSCVVLGCNTPPAHECLDATRWLVYASVGTCGDEGCTYKTQELECPLGCDDGACLGDPCAGITCETPPADECVDATNLRVYDEGPGICESGSCSHGFSEISCVHGCDAGACNPVPAVPCVQYVNGGIPIFDRDGDSWATAHRTIQPAIDEAYAAVGGLCPDGTEVWVAAATYYMYGAEGAGSVADHLSLRNNVRVYGGFQATETDRAQRDPVQNETILDGRNNADGVERTFHIAVCREVYGCGSGAVIDGFTFTAAAAVYDDGGSDNIGFNESGACVYTDRDMQISNCVFLANYAVRAGGAVMAADAAPTIQDCLFLSNQSGFGGAIAGDGYGANATIERCSFIDNYADYTGGAISFSYGAPSIENSVFIENVALEYGGAIYVEIDQGSQTIQNCSFSKNQAFTAGSAIHNGSSSPSELYVVNCAMGGNLPFSVQDAGVAGANTHVSYSIAGADDTLPGTTNIQADPRFVDPNSDLRLQSDSPAIDRGDDGAAPPTDYDGVSRVDDPAASNCPVPGPDPECGWISDMGAFERPL